MSLRNIEEQDLELILQWRNHPSVRKSMFNQEVISLEDHKAWFSRESKKEDSCWLLYLNPEDKPAGVIYCTSIDRINSHTFWGFYAAPDSSPGTGTAMCSEGLSYIFNVLRLNKVNAEVIESNLRSHAFHIKMGFKVEGEFSEQYKGKLGYESVTRYARFRHD